MRYSRMRQLADMTREELLQVLFRDIRKIPTARVKRRLRGYLFCRARIDSNVEHLASLESAAQKITAAYKAVPGGGGTGSGRAEVVSQIIQLQKYIKAESKRLQEELQLVQFMINSLDNYQERIVLNYRYINGKTFEEIADKMHYELRQVYRIHGRTLKKLVALEEKMSLNVSHKSDII